MTTSTLRRPRVAPLLAALGAAVALLAPGISQAEAVTSGDWTADWKPVLCVDSGCVVQAGQASGSGQGGTMTISATMPKSSSVNGSMNVSFDAANGTLRSGTQVDATISGVAAPTALGWGDFSFSSTNRLIMFDTLTVDHAGFGFVKISVLATGTMSQTGKILDAPDGYSSVSLRNDLLILGALQGGPELRTRLDDLTVNETIENSFNGLFDGVHEVSDQRSVHSFAEMIAPWEDDQPILFGLVYEETLKFSVQGVDARQVDLSADNSFGHTLKLYADVYDSAGNWLQGVTVGSSSGIRYTAFGTGQPGTVPEPSSLALALGAVLGLAVRRRRGA